MFLLVDAIVLNFLGFIKCTQKRDMFEFRLRFFVYQLKKGVYLKLPEIASILGFKDLRTAKKWCKTNSVCVYSDSGFKRSYVIEAEFQQARLKVLIAYLRKEHGQNWIEAFKSYMNTGLFQKSFGQDISSITKADRRVIYSSGPQEKAFLSSLTSSNPEL